ncbi:phage terminase large subunit family protein [Gemmata sp. JC717]|uniref:phage terminase large subunit family protein n=1 Tax=Gemmata algarum TaxID=2975278 RepID=UPI0021BAE1D2|nr:phage terminase large subunit family protein [Gemmata algarum]MDY3555891.1 phage terminase large subunit family protein [Gemmata algarum]
MSTPRFTAAELGQLRELAAAWGKIVSKRAFGEDGPGLDVDFRTMEQIATAAAQGLTEGTLQQMLQQQARKVPAQYPCPDCDTPCPTEPHTRTLTAQGAQVEQTEWIAHGPARRRDFFPPADGPGTG